MTARCRYSLVAPLLSGLIFSTVAFSDTPSSADAGQLKRTYGANQWHMNRFMSEYLSREKELQSDPANERLKSRMRTLKNQIDVLTRENERILNEMDESQTHPIP